jgi:TonB family protein
MRIRVGLILLAGLSVHSSAQFRAAAARLDRATELDRSMAISATRPYYPYEARLNRITGSGIVVMEIDPSTGEVKRATMAQSTGSEILDRAALDAFRRWRFKPGTRSPIKTPITFTMGGNIVTEYAVKRKPMDEALERFLGKGTVIKGPIPEYPRSVPWTDKAGKGVYELHVQKDGKVSEVRILKRSGDDMFDRITVNTLRTWRLSRGPLILELPLSFKLSPTKYSVDIPKNR